MTLKPLEKKIKQLIIYANPLRWKAYRQLLAEREALLVSDKDVLFRFNSEFWHDDMGRYVYLLVKSFVRAGYQPVFFPEYGFLSRLKKYKKLLIKEKFSISFQSNIDKDSIYLSEENSSMKVHAVKAKEAIVFSSSSIPIPYMMHPNIYDKEIDQQLKELRKNHKKGKILFAGSLNPKAYSGGRVEKLYHKVPRFTLIRHLEKTLPSEQLLSIRSEKDFASKEYQNKLTIVDTQYHKIPFENWLSTLGKYDFFLACPGSDMPMCHNAVEAMAVGSIPILEYAEYFHPVLEHGVNCISFNGTEDLLRKVKEVLDMEGGHILSLRQNVMDYYDKYLAPTSWIKQLASRKDQQSTLIFNAWKIPE